jgi:hypothetical protein
MLILSLSESGTSGNQRRFTDAAGTAGFRCRLTTDALFKVPP